MVGMNFNGVVKGNELRLVAKEIFKKATANSGEAESGAAIIKNNPFQDILQGRAEFMPIETKTAKMGFEQSGISIDNGVKNSFNALAAIDKYSNLAFRSQGEMALNPSPVLEVPAFLEASSIADEGKKNPFLLMLAAMFSKDGENAAEDPLKILLSAAMASKK